MNKKVIIATLIGVTVVGMTLSMVVVLSKGEEEKLHYNKRKNVVIASVGDKKLTLGDLDKIEVPYIQSPKSEYGENFEEVINKKIEESTGEEKREFEKKKEDIIKEREFIADRFITEKTLAFKGREVKIKDEEEIEKDVEDNFNLTKALYDVFYKESDKDEKFLDEKLKDLVRDKVYAMRVYQAIGEKSEATEEQCRQYYDENIDKYTKKAGLLIDEIAPYENVKREISLNILGENSLRILKTKTEEWTKDLKVKYKKKVLSF